MPAVDQVCRQEVKPHEALKGSRYVPLKNEKNWTEKQNEIFKAIQVSNDQVSAAWRLRESIRTSLEATRTPKPVPASSYGLKA